MASCLPIISETHLLIVALWQIEVGFSSNCYGVSAMSKMIVQVCLTGMFDDEKDELYDVFTSVA